MATQQDIDKAREAGEKILAILHGDLAYLDQFDFEEMSNVALDVVFEDMSKRPGWFFRILATTLKEERYLEAEEAA